LQFYLRRDSTLLAKVNQETSEARFLPCFPGKILDAKGVIYTSPGREPWVKRY
jgi:hypothetical protein